ncbi:MAG: TPM domain-containing protein [Sulfurospirillaceae bacterium]|nr:TPM domain-containing protein [Sulfurospirillaceae bacterium]MDD3462709.1 TPM domain-containing protein [Sulfurospirillaceae bacterium]
MFFYKKAFSFSLLFATLFFFTPNVFALGFVINEDVIDARAALKIGEISQELFKKTKITLYLIAKKNGGSQDIVAFEKEFGKTVQEPFVLLTLFLDEKKVDIYRSSSLEKAFDKDAILSPFPWRGTIIPLLTGKKENVSVSAAMLNGYADIAEQIADFKGVKLQSSIGNTNKTTIFFVKIAVYGFLLFVLIAVFVKRRRGRVR